MGEMAHAMKLLGGLPTAIQKYPSGRYGIVGSIPGELTQLVTRKHTPQIPPLRESLSWGTEEEAISALLAIGITRFQRADCSWYGDAAPFGGGR